MKDTDFSIQDYFVFDQKRFQKTINGKQTDLYILKNKLGMAVGVTNYGCALTAIFVPDKFTITMSDEDFNMALNLF